MLVAPGAYPEMVAVFVRREDLVTRFAHATARDVGIRTGVLLLVARAIPIMFAVSIQSANGFAGFAIPAVIEVFVRRMRRTAFGAEPKAVRAYIVHRVVGIRATRTRPEVSAIRIIFDNGGTLRAIHSSAFAVGIQREILFAICAIPGMSTGNGFGGIVRRRTIFAVPVTVFAGLGKHMRRRMARAIPGVTAMRLVGSGMVR